MVWLHFCFLVPMQKSPQTHCEPGPRGQECPEKASSHDACSLEARAVKTAFPTGRLHSPKSRQSIRNLKRRETQGLAQGLSASQSHLLSSYYGRGTLTSTRGRRDGDESDSGAGLCFSQLFLGHFSSRRPIANLPHHWQKIFTAVEPEPRGLRT